MSHHQKDAYIKRFEKVFNYIDAHLDESITVQRLSEIANFSPYHFHRQFVSQCGISVGRYIQLMRLKRASYRLAFNAEEKVIDIAFDAGFQNSESFSRAFKNVFGVAPSVFRQNPVWEAWHQCIPKYKPIRKKNMDVKIIDFPQTPVGMITHKGQPERIYETATRFIEWRKTTGLSPIATSQTYAITPHDPATTPHEDFLFHICGTVTQPIDENNDFGIRNSIIPQGRCAVLRHNGSHDDLTEKAWYLYKEWLPESGEELRDFPLFMHYHNFIHEVPEHELITDIYLPLK